MVHWSQFLARKTLETILKMRLDGCVWVGSVYLSEWVSVSVWVSLYVPGSVCVGVCVSLSFSVCLNMSLYESLSVSGCLNLWVCVCLSVSLSVCVFLSGLAVCEWVNKWNVCESTDLLPAEVKTRLFTFWLLDHYLNVVGCLSVTSSVVYLWRHKLFMCDVISEVYGK